MKTLAQHIKNRTFSKVYLFCGTEDYFIKLYKKKLKDAVLPEDDSMNYAHFEGSQTDENELRALADTLPFFADNRLIIYENSGYFKKACDFADYVKDMPDSTILVFVESEVDKRNRMYKAVKDNGTIVEFNAPDEQTLKLFAYKKISDAGKKVLESTIMFMIEYIGADMQKLETELEKILSFVGAREVVTPEDVKEVCTEQLSGKVFQLTEAIGSKDTRKTFVLYKTLIDMKEKPLSILFHIIRHFNIMLQVKELAMAGRSNANIASDLAIMPFLVGKYISQARKFSTDQIKYAVEYGTQLEEDVKKGLMNEKMAVEFLVVKLIKM